MGFRDMISFHSKMPVLGEQVSRWALSRSADGEREPSLTSGEGDGQLSWTETHASHQKCILRFRSFK